MKPSQLKYIILIALFQSVLIQTFGQSRWLNLYFGNENTYGQDFKECYDNGYILTGKHGDGLVHYLWLIKTDINGQVLWEKTFGEFNSFLSFYYLDINKSGDIFLSGASSYHDPFRDPIVMKLNSCGEKEWCLNFSTPDHFDYAHSIVATDDGGCAVVLRYTGISPPQTDRICLAKIDAEGKLLWKSCYNSPDTNLITEDSRALLRTPDQGYLITGVCDYYDNLHHLHPKQYYIKTDSLGNFQWETVVHPEDNTNGGDAWTTFLNPDSNFYYSSVSHYYFASDFSSPAFIKLDLEGNVIGIYDIVNGYINGGLAYAQFINDSMLAASCGWGNTEADIKDYATLIDTLGNIIDTTLLIQDIYGSTLRICRDKKLTHMYNTLHNDQFDVYLRKLNFNLEDDTLYTRPFTYDSLCSYQIALDTIVPDDCGLIVGIEEQGGGEAGGQGGLEAGGHGGMEVWPNPARGEIHVRLNVDDGRHNKDLTLEIYDIYGRTAPAITTGNAGADGREGGWSVNVSSLPPGIYFISALKDGKRISGGKFIVAR
jgi:hypothetical protein